MSEERYFPPGALHADPRTDGFLANFYSSHLTAMEEPPMWGLEGSGGNVRIFRTLFLPSFHNPVAARLIVDPDGTGRLYSKMTSGQGGYDPEKLVHSACSSIDLDRMAAFLALVNTSDLQEVPSDLASPGADGVSWLFEVVMDGQFRVLQRSNPQNVDALAALGLVLVRDLANIEVS